MDGPDDESVDDPGGFTVATDGPEMMHVHLRDELAMLERIGALDADEIRTANARGHEAAFGRSETATSGV